MRLAARLDAWIYGFLPASPRGLAAARIAFASYFLFLRGVPRFAWVSDNPPGFFDPPTISLAALFTDFPGAGPLRILDLAMVILFVFLLVGYRTRLTSVLLTVLWIVGSSFMYSFGKIDHSIMAVITPAVMASSGWGATWSLDAKRRPGRLAAVHAWPLAMLALLLAFGFFSAGLPKLVRWVDFDLATHGARSWLVQGYYLGRDELLAPFFMQVGSPVFWEVVDLVAVAFELTFIVSLANRRVFRTYLVAAIAFNFANVLMLNIGFLSLLPVYLVFAPWERVVDRLPGRLTAAAQRITSRVGMAGLLLLFVPLYALSPRLTVDAYLTPLGVAVDLLAPGYDIHHVTSLVAFPLAFCLALAMPRDAGTCVRDPNGRA